MSNIINLLINSRILIQDTVSLKLNCITYQQEKNLLISGVENE